MEDRPAPENIVSQPIDWGLDIVSRSTPKKRRRENLNSIDSKDEEIIEKFEECLEKSLTEKAAKSNLSKVAVRSILKYVVTDENVLALLKHKENGEDASEVIPFEPKITRSKAKELSNSGSSLLLPWDQTASNDSKVLELLADDLHEESSDDEYVPAEEESEDDSSFCCTASNPPTPSTKKQNIVDDEGFKAPQLKKVKYEVDDDDDHLQFDEAANIALRTRSKLSLSETPLEKIEQSFVPPDITNDMYELECNDDDWKNFLNSFAQPLDDVKNAEEEDLDPEYNILSDEEITKVDTEELRDDRAVRVPKRELNDLIAELFEYVDIYENRKDFQNDNLEINIDPDSYPIQQLELDRYIEIFDGASNKQIDLNLEEDAPPFGREPTSDVCLEYFKAENPLDNLFSKIQLQLLLQQMCQHVQMLLQNFILTFNHPCFSEYATEFKEFLFNFKLLSGSKDFSVFNTINLDGALAFMENWEKKFAEQSEEALETIKHFEKVMEESIECFKNKKYYYLPLPESILKTISESEVFIYPQLLPKIPFKHPDLQNYNYASFSTSEYQLVALGLEQFVQFLINDKEFLYRRKEINIRKIAEVIQKMLMPARKIYQIYRNISEKKHSKDRHNPITFYFKNKRAPYTVHQVIDLNQFGILPPKQRPANLLPRQWRRFIYHETQDEGNEEFPEMQLKPVPPVLKEPTVYRKIVPKGDIAEEKKVSEVLKSKKTLYNYYLKKRCENCFRKAIPYVAYNNLKKNFEFLIKFFPHQKIHFNSDSYKEDNMISLGMLRSIPSLKAMTNVQKESVKDCGVESVVEGEQRKIVLSHSDMERANELLKTDTLLIASLTVKNNGKDQYLIDEKKSEERKKFLASIATLAPPNLEADKERRRKFSIEYMNKLQEKLGLITFGKLMKIFSKEKLSNAVDLYMKFKTILLPKHQDLADEFLRFLTTEQAFAIEQLVPFFIMNHMPKFLRSLKLYSKDQPAQIRIVYESFQDLKHTPEVNLEGIKKAILPLLERNPLLSDSFLQIFLEESSPDSLLNGAWDVIEVNKKLNKAKEEGAFENLAVTNPVSDDCHRIIGKQLQKHPCNNNGIKFIRGETPKNVSTLPVPNEIIRMDPTFNKSSSSCEEIIDGQTYIESEEERKGKVPLYKSTKKFTPKQKISGKNPKESGETKICSERRRLGQSKITTQTNVETQKTIPVSDNKTICNERTTNEGLGKAEIIIQSNIETQEKPIPVAETDWKNLPSLEYMDTPLSNTNSSLEEDKTLIAMNEEITICKEEITITEETIKKELINEDILHNWTKEEDRILLETYKENFQNDPIPLIKQQLQNRSEEEIRSRFDYLMNLLQEMSSREDSKNIKLLIVH